MHTKLESVVWKRRLIVLIMHMCGVFLFSQNPSNFVRLPFNINNQSVKVTHSVQDDMGYIWLAHASGISKYDGYNFEFIPRDRIFNNAVSSDEVKSVFRDGLGVIWALSLNGDLSFLQKNGTFSPLDQHIQGFAKNYSIEEVSPDGDKIWMATKTGVVYSYDHAQRKMDSITSIPITGHGRYGISSMVVRQSKQLILSTYKGPIYLYDLQDKTKNILNFPYDYSLSDNTLLLLDKQDRLWVGSSYVSLGILVYDFDKEAFVQNTLFKIQPKGQINELFSAMYCDVDGFVWLGTDGNGLYRVDPISGAVRIYRHNDLNMFSLSTNTVIHINEDLRNNLWVLTNYGDINVLRKSDNHINYHPGTVSLKPTRILSSYKANDGTLWIGTDGEGLSKIPEFGSSNKFFENTLLHKGFYIHSINEDKDSNIWVGTYQNGLHIYNSRRNSFQKKVLVDANGHSVQDVRFIFRDSQNRMWVTTDQGLFVFLDSNTLLAEFGNNSNGLVGNISQSIVEDTSQNIWVATNGGGLFKFNENKTDFSRSSFRRYTNLNEQELTNKNNDILAMASVGDETIWMISVNGRLAKFNIDREQIQLVKLQTSANNGFDNSPKAPVFKSILQKDQDNIWLGSTTGLWHYNIADSIVKVYQERDGLQSDFFMQRSAHKGSDGYFYFGGLNGVNYFKPELIRKEEFSAELVIEGMEILNQPAIAVVPEQLQDGLEKIEQLNLKYDQSSFSLRFLAIDNILFSNYNYGYRLKGFNDSWIFAGNERLATYTNIPPGDYIFEVRAGTKTGKWDIEQKSVAIRISEPFWNTGWAHLFYFILGCGLLYGIFLWARIRNKMQAEKLQHHHEKEIYALKMNFFAKMSHEIQTPLTLILIPLEDMMARAMKNGNELLQQRLRLISNNAKRLSRIVFELTSLRDKELDKLVLRPTQVNIIGHLREIANAFNEQAKFKGISFKCNYPKEDLVMWYDRDKLEHIVFNLLSNAFKFTPKEGAVLFEVEVEEENRMIKISVTDSGPGIPKSELDNIFQLFYQANSGKESLGTGIGLALTKELVDLHEGKIDVTSEIDKGACFSIYLPIKEGEIIASQSIEHESILEYPIDKENIDFSIPKPQEHSKKLTKTLLIVEDNFELQISLRDIFLGYYNVLLAENGEEGLQLAMENQPNIIITDVMMSKMDGIEMSANLQKNEATAHIPIIMLTAKKTHQSKLMGLRAGAIEFIGKPFKINELILKVNNIVTKNDRLVLKYKNDLISTPKDGPTISQDAIFLEKLVALIEEEISNPDFKLDDLSASLNMSYSAIYRKFQSLTGKKIVDFVRTMRLKKAAILLAECNYSVSETAFLVGFNDPKYFSKAFKKEHGVTPGKYRGKSDLINPTDLITK
ncbi:Sensor histidine kinase RcsC [Arenibacter antarcticus]